LPKGEFKKDLTYGLLTFVPYLMLFTYPMTTEYPPAERLTFSFMGLSIFPVLGAIIKTGLRGLGNKLMRVHGSVRKILLVLLAMAILFFLLLIAGALTYSYTFYSSEKPSHPQ
jgi:hypothetical protein